MGCRCAALMSITPRPNPTPRPKLPHLSVPPNCAADAHLCICHSELCSISDLLTSPPCLSFTLTLQHAPFAYDTRVYDILKFWQCICYSTKSFPCIKTALPCSINQIQQSKKTVEIPCSKRSASKAICMLADCQKLHWRNQETDTERDREINVRCLFVATCFLLIHSLRCQGNSSMTYVVAWAGNTGRNLWLYIKCWGA